MDAINPVTVALVESLQAIKAQPEVHTVSLRYNSPAEFDLCVTWGKWLMKRFEDRGLKVRIEP